MVRVLALDLSTRVGWAVDPLDGPAGAPRMGLWSLPGLLPATVDAANSKLFDLIESAILHYKPEVLFFEDYMPAGGKDGQRNSKIGQALAGQVYIAGMAGFRASLRVRSALPATVRKHFCGHGRPKDRKLAVIRACHALGWEPSDDNEADAAAIWHYAKCLYEPAWAPTATPLFRAAAQTEGEPMR